MIKKSKKILASLLMALFLVSIIPVTNVFAYTSPDENVTQDENEKYLKFIHEECTPTEEKYVYYNKDNGKYYGLTITDAHGLTMAQNTGVATGHYGKEDGSLAQSEWIYRQSTDDKYYWEYYGADRIKALGYQTIDGKKYFFNENTQQLRIGWWRDSAYKWHYSYPDGSIKEGWLNDNGYWYYIYSDGLMAKDTTTPDGYYVNKKGIWA